MAPEGTPRRGRLARAAMLGLVAGMLAGGLVFLGAWLRRPAVDCIGLSPAGCTARQSLEQSMARTHLAAGLALLVSAAGFWLLVRREDKSG
jgi:uncharacterized membrane protein